MARTASNDPLEKFRFTVDITFGDTASNPATPGKAVSTTPLTTAAEVGFTRLGFHDVQLPKRTTSKISYREGQMQDINTLSAGLTTMEEVVMSRGLLTNAGSSTNDDFYQWISTVYTGGSGTNDFSLAAPGGAIAYRGTVLIKMLDRAGNVARAWQLNQAWPTHFAPGSDLNAGEDGEKSLQSMTLAYEDFYEIDVTTSTPATTPPGAPSASP